MSSTRPLTRPPDLPSSGSSSLVMAIADLCGVSEPDPEVSHGKIPASYGGAMRKLIDPSLALAQASWANASRKDSQTPLSGENMLPLLLT